MSEATHPTGALTRRGFLKGASVTAGALGLAGVAGMTATDGWLVPAKAMAEPEEKVAYTYHQNHCHGNCSLKCTVREGRLCVIEPNDAYEDDLYRTCCVKGMSEVEHIYGNGRVQTPLKRVGERGSRDFVQISWDEAISEIADKIQELWAQYGPESILVNGGSEARNRFPFLQAMLGAHGRGSFDSFDEGQDNGMANVIGGVGSTSEDRNWLNARTLFMVSTNHLESCVATAKCFFRAQDNGTHIVVIDPNYSTTASKADEWIPIEPGTDGALFLGMVTAIIDNHWYDEASMKSNTSFPFLVDVESGLHMRLRTPSDADETGEENPFMVWDSVSQAPVSYLECENPVLEGTYTINGKTYATVFELVKENCRQHSTKWASEKTTIPEEAIIDLARQYACNTPSTLALGVGGGDKFDNADMVGHAACLLPALTNNYNGLGKGFGRYQRGKTASLASWPLPDNMKKLDTDIPYNMFPYVDNPIRCLISMGDLLQQQMGYMPANIEWAKKLDFIVCIETYMTDTTNWADIVLPSTTSFESTEMVENVKTHLGYLRLREGVIDPLFESKTEMEIERLLAKALGRDSALPKSSEEYVRYLIDEADDEDLDGYTFEMLYDNQGLLPLHNNEELKESWDSTVAKTISGRFHLYDEKRLPYGQAIPTYFDPSEVYAGSELKEKYPFWFNQVRTKYFIHNQFCDSEWIRYFVQPYAEMNPVDMEKCELQDEDLVRIFNDRGEVSCRVRSNNMCRPGQVMMIEGWWSKYMENGNFQNLSNHSVNERSDSFVNGPSFPVLDTLVQIERV